MRYFISDTHFGHSNIIRYEDRPYGDTYMMDEAMICRWNEIVSDDDTVYFLGDFALGPLGYCRDIFNRLKGRKTAIIGNHDKSYACLAKIGFVGVFEEAVIRIEGKMVKLMHHYIPGALNDDVDFIMHGHVHSKRPFEIVDRMLNISVEVIDYRPVSEKLIGEMMRKYKAKPQSVSS